MMHLFLTGVRNIGKSTIVREAVRSSGVRTGGLQSLIWRDRRKTDVHQLKPAAENGSATGDPAAEVLEEEAVYLIPFTPDPALLTSEPDLLALLQEWGSSQKLRPAGRRNLQDLSVEAYPDVFDAAADTILSPEKISGCALIVLDELGFMERTACHFQERILQLLDGRQPVLGVIREAAPFLNRVRSHPQTQILRVTKENRKQAKEQVLDFCKTAAGKQEKGR